MIHFVTNLADQAVVLPLILAVLVLLLAVGERRAAAWWAAAMAISLGGTLLAKLVMIPCGHLLPDFAVTSPSGHTASAAAAYSGIIMLGAQATRSSTGRLTALALGALIVCMVAVSRVMLHAHTVQETLVGAVIGAAAPLLLAVPRPLFIRSAVVEHRWMLALPLLVIPFVFGHQANAEGWISRFAWQAAYWLSACGT
jgi:membrane-associated phospholipid phosphatase